MRLRSASLVAFGIAFLLAALVPMMRNDSARPVEAFQFAIVAFACLGTASFMLIAKFRQLTKWALFAAIFALLQGLLHCAVLVLWLLGER